MKFKKLALITAFGILSTSVANAVTDEVEITGTINQLVDVVVAPTETITMDNVANPITVDVKANVEFKIKVASDGNGNLLLEHTTNGVNATVAYTFDLKDGAGTSIIAVKDTFSGTQDPIDTTSAGTDSWDLEVTTTGVDGTTLAGIYTDTLTLTIEAI